MFRQLTTSIKPYAAAIAAIAGAFWFNSSTLAQEKVRKRETTQVTTYRPADEFKMATRWDKSSTLVGRTIISSSNENLGKIEDVVVDPNSGRILYGVASFSEPLGTTEKLYPIPWYSFEPRENNAVVLKVEKEKLKAAPSFERAHWPNFADRQYVMTTYKYYDAPLYWESSDGDTSVVTERTPTETTTYYDRWYEPPHVWQKTTELIGRNVRNRQNEELGQFVDYSIDPDTGRIMYGILSYNGKYYSIPWPVVTYSTDSKYVVVDVPRDRLVETASFEPTRWPNFVDEPWATKTYTYYHAEPYWTKEYTVKYDKHGKAKIKEKTVKKG